MSIEISHIIFNVLLSISLHIQYSLNTHLRIFRSSSLIKILLHHDTIAYSLNLKVKSKTHEVVLYVYATVHHVICYQCSQNDLCAMKTSIRQTYIRRNGIRNQGGNKIANLSGSSLCSYVKICYVSFVEITILYATLQLYECKSTIRVCTSRFFRLSFFFLNLVRTLLSAKVRVYRFSRLICFRVTLINGTILININNNGVKDNCARRVRRRKGYF